jgi:hypothetical protein
MEKKKKTIKQPVIVLPEKHPLEEPPAEPDDSVISEEDLDKIPDEEEEEVPPYEPPVPGEGP